MIDNLKNEGLFQSMFQLTTEGILVVDNNGTILKANPACKNLFGYNPDFLLSKNIEILIPEKHKAQLKKHLINLDKTTINKDFDLFGIKKDGTEFRLEIRLNSKVIDNENLIIIFLQDTSKCHKNLLEIKQTKDKLKENNHKFHTLRNNIKGILFRFENNSDYTMHYISEGCLELTGYPFADFINRSVNFGQLILEVDRNKVWEHIQTAIKNKTAYDFEYRIKHKNGGIKYVWEKGKALYNSQKEVIALESFITDITGYKEQEFTLKANEAKTKALLEVMPDMMFIQDRKGNYIDYYTNTPEKLLLPPEKFLGLNMKNVLPPDAYKIIKTSQNKAIESGKMQVAEFSNLGEKKIDYYEARVVPMNNHKLLTIVREITEEKVKDAQLNIKDNALESVSNSIVIADAQKPNVPIIYSNTAFEKMTGYKKEEVYGRNCNFLQDDDRDQKAVNIMRNAITKGENCNVVLRNYKKDGTLFWNDVTITPLHDNNNKLTHFIAIQNDVTKRVKAEDLKDKKQQILELIAQDKPLKTIVEKIISTVETHLKDCFGSISLLDKENKTLHFLAAPNLPKAFYNYVNNIAIGPNVGSCGTAAFLKKEVLVANIATHVLWEDYKEMALKNGLKACWAFPIMSSTKEVLGVFSIYSLFARQPLNFEKEMLLDMIYLASIAIEKDNNKNTLQESKKQLVKYAKNLEDKVQERTQEVMATVKELVTANLNLEDQIIITKQAEREALLSKKIISTVAKNFPKGFIAVMNKDLQLVLAEGEALKQLGLNAFVFVGMTIDVILDFAEERKAKIKEYISKTLSGNHLSFEMEYKNRYFSVNTVPLFDDNKLISHALMVYNDISHHKEIEFNIQKALKKEKELNELKSRFVSMASHEFRTPLSAILTSAILIGKQNGPGKEFKREKYVAQIENNVKHLVNILNDFLSLSKIEEGEVEPTLKRIDLVSFSKLLIKEIKPTLKKEQTIILQTDNDTLFINLDEKLLRHILNNLLSNASKYSDENNNIDFKISQNQGLVAIKITDEGIGIPKEEQQHLFTRFFRAKNAGNIEGTGLGLNIAKRYTELMGGTINHKNNLNKGSTFKVEFPIDIDRE